MRQGSIDLEKFQRAVPKPDPAFANKLEKEFSDVPPAEPAPSISAENSKKPQLILPSGEVSIIESATILFKQLAKTHRYFARGRLVVEVVCNKEGNEVLSPLRASAFRSRMEKDFRLLVWRSPRGERMLKPAHCPKDIAEAFLESDPSIDYLPGISLLVSSPILAEQNGELVALNKGYHEVAGGIYVERRIEIEELPLEKALKSLLGLLADFSNLPAAWKHGKASVAGILAQLSVQRGKPMPWFLVQRAVDGALRARLVELDPDSASWPCDPSAASKVTLKAISGGVKPINGDGGSVVNEKGVTYSAYLRPNELQDLADGLSEILDLQAKHGIKIRFNLFVEAASDGDIGPEASAELRKALEEISDAFH
jgi:hypothetical protein